MALDPRKVVGGMFGSGLPGAFGLKEQVSPLEKWRKKKPEHLDQAEWDALLDDLNKQFQKGSAGIGSDPRAMRQAEEMSRWTLEDVIAAGQRSGTLTKDARRDKKKATAAEIEKDARDRNAADATAQANLEAESAIANDSEAAALAELRAKNAAASGAFHQTAANARKSAEDANAAARGLHAGMGRDFLALNEQDQNALAEYLKATDPLMAEVMAGSGATSGADMQRQLDAHGNLQTVFDKYNALTDPTVTAKERYLSEVARREFEAADKSNREAVSEQLANRGLRSGGQQIALGQAESQRLSQDRLLKELGIQAGAVDRSMTALEGAGTTANNQALSAGAIRTANQAQDDFRLKEAERRSKLAGERLGATNKTTEQVAGRDETYATTGIDVEGDAYDRLGDADKYDWGATEKDAGMASEEYGATTGAAGRRVARSAGVGSALGGMNIAGHNRLINALGIGIDQDVDEEEYDLANG